MTHCTGFRYHVNPDAPDEGTDIHHDGPCPVHDTEQGMAGFTHVVESISGACHEDCPHPDHIESVTWQEEPGAIEAAAARLEARRTNPLDLLPDSPMRDALRERM